MQNNCYEECGQCSNGISLFTTLHTLVVESILNNGGVHEHYKVRIGIVLSKHLT